MPKPLEIKDLGIAKLRKQLAELAATKLTFGYQGKSGAEKHPGTKDRYTVAQVARMHEFGKGAFGGDVSFPARPLGRHTMEENRDRFKALGKKTISDVIDGRAEPEAAIEAAGEVAVGALRRSISRSREWAAANAPSTIKAKGHDHPLIGEHQMLTLKASWALRDKKTGRIVRQGGEE